MYGNTLQYMSKAKFPDKLEFIVKSQFVYLFISSLIFSACSSTQPSEDSASAQDIESEEFETSLSDSSKPSDKRTALQENNAAVRPLKMRPLALSPDGFPKIKEYSKNTENKKLVTQRDYDFNGDGKIDFIEKYSDDGQFTQSESADLDGDGSLETTLYFEKKLIDKIPVLTRQEVKSLGKDQINIWKFYDKDLLVRREVDRNGKGRPDYWEYYKDGKITHIEQDNDGDGIPDNSPKFRKIGTTTGKDPS